MWTFVASGSAGAPMLPHISGGVGSAGTAYVAGAVATVIIAHASRRFFGGRRAAGTASTTQAQRRHLARAASEGGAAADLESFASQPAKRLSGSYAIWNTMRKALPELLNSWASEAENDEQKTLLTSLAAAEIDQGLIPWALAEASSTPSGIGGFYLLPPCAPQVIAIIEAVDEERNLLRHIAVNPKQRTPGLDKMIQDWVQSLQGKKLIVSQPEELRIFGVQIIRDNKSASGGATVSKGL
mmetsp:Transcript_24712/g.70322  ORF Transcript_24712/g.70322 Transcript_24712/m.70322 type:complete len:241 (+) Transcript_24712:81-803(+)